ncbi:glutathione peroxidase [Peredibacter starrii]|uniref:Glutathione peroxidase n=1 Tax=Peredibacter starrii TaxID=28202 RepID=A0AAX4HL77_9BACT|nr:glutathione peroxidase [Peredibacter starrii]WPU63945.1 glutathione peroxidase [Peredibacter starrii]
MRFLAFLLFLTNVAFAQDFYAIKDKSIKGDEFKMESLKGKTVLVVNIASQCGYTPQLEGLESLYKKYQAKNFVLLGVPTNDFGGQTPEDDKGMLEFCQKNYNVTFPVLTKKTILGKEKRELYKFLTSGQYKGEVSWNFEKFLVNKEGKVVGRFGSSTKPDDSKLTKAIESSL